jgi:DNA-binding NarL/FixJ family response regulator
MQEPAVVVDDPEVVVLFTDTRTRARVREGLHRQNVRVAQPERLLEWVTAHRPHVVLVTGDDERAGRARAAVARAAPEAACVVLVDHPTPARYRELLATCTAVLPESAAEEDVAVAVAGAWRALSCLPTEAARTLSGAPGVGAGVALTPREVAWLRALADGATVGSLARAAGYSQREMYRLLAGLYARLGTTGRTEALLRADRAGLLSSEGPDAGDRTQLVAAGAPQPGRPRPAAPGAGPAGPRTPALGVPRPGRGTGR